MAAGINMLMGMLRPHAPGPDEDKTALRFAFEIAHRVVGYGCLVLCENQIYGAFVLKRRVDLHAIDATPTR